MSARNPSLLNSTAVAGRCWIFASRMSGFLTNGGGTMPGVGIT
jgi:hypothetical protein